MAFALDRARKGEPMCGRFSLHLLDLNRIIAELGPTRSGIEHWEPRYNVAPSQQAPVILVGKETQRLLALQWGFVPHFARKPSGTRPINARGETAGSKPLFRDAFERRRCVVPATGYFEWARTAPAPGTTKQPYWIHPQNPDDGLYMAGLWSHCKPLEGPTLTTFAIVTRGAVGPPAAIHHRMPLILRADEARSWLQPGSVEADWYEHLLQRPADGAELAVRPVNKVVNRAGLDSPQCLEEVAPKEQLSLF